MTFAFADPGAGLYGLARLGLSGAAQVGNAVALLFADGEPVATVARGDVPVGAPADLEADEPAAHVAGMTGYEQLCHVHGTVRVGAATRELRGLGQRGHMWGAPDWDRIDAARYVGAWLEDGSAVVLRSVRPAGASFEHEASWAAVLGTGGTLRVDEPRLSTTYDDQGRPQRAGLELWVGEEDACPRRAAGEVLCGSTLDLGCVRMDCAFLRWRMDGRAGVGRYDVLRRA